MVIQQWSAMVVPERPVGMFMCGQVIEPTVYNKEYLKSVKTHTYRRLVQEDTTSWYIPDMLTHVYKKNCVT